MNFKYLLVFGSGFLALNLIGCSVLNKPAQIVDKFIGATLFPSYSGPKAGIIVADFSVKAAKATEEVGFGLRDMLAGELSKANRFILVPARNDTLDRTAKLIIATEVVDFEPRASGGSLGIGGGGSAASGTLGSLLGTSANKSTIALNIRIVDAVSSKVLTSGRVSGQAVDTGTVSPESLSKPNILNEYLPAYANSSMGEAINKCIAEAVKYIVQAVPSSYYKEEKNGEAQTQGKAELAIQKSQ